MLRSQAKQQKKVAPKKATQPKKQLVKVAKRKNCHSHTHVEPRKAGVRLGQSALSAKFPAVAGQQVLPGSLDIKPFSTEADLSEGYAVLFSYPLDFTYVFDLLIVYLR